MRKSRFTEAQIIGILKQAEGGATVADLAPDPVELRPDELRCEQAGSSLHAATRI